MAEHDGPADGELVEGCPVCDALPDVIRTASGAVIVGVFERHNPGCPLAAERLADHDR